MTPVLVLLAAVIAGGAVAAVSAATPRLAALGVFVVLAGSPYLANPLPSTPALGARLVGAVLAGYTLWVALRDVPAPTSGWRPGWPGAAALAVAGLAVGYLGGDGVRDALTGVVGEGPATAGVAPGLAAGSAAAQAALGAALALVVLAAGPIVLSRDVLRGGVGLLLLLAAAGILVGILGGHADDALQVGLAALTAAAGVGVAAVAARSLALHGDFELRAATRRDGVVRQRRPDDAHPLDRAR